MKIKSEKRFFGGLNSDDNPANLPEGDYVGALNIRTGGSSEQHGEGILETLQGEIGILISPDSTITYYGTSIGGQFVYSGYDEIVIGTQTWMKKNYDVNYPGSKVYDDDEDNAPIYGRLYTHDQIMSSTFCPAGWRVPTEADIDTLLTYLGGVMIAGGKMKNVGTELWTTPNTGADDLSAFTAVPGGKFDLLFELLGNNCLLWLQDDGVPEAPVALNGSEITVTTFVTNWSVAGGATGYYLDVATDALFTSLVAGYNNLDVGNVLTYSIIGLSPFTNYYYRVRGYNEVGTGDNSNIQTIKTLDGVVDADGNAYTYVTIGNQQWLVENLKTTKYADGTPILNITDNTQWTNAGSNLVISSTSNGNISSWASPVENPISQSFTVGNSTVSGIELSGSLGGSPNFNIRLSIYTSVGDLPSVKIADSLNIATPGDISAGVIFLFNNIDLAAGTYCFVVSYEDVITHDQNNCISLAFQTGDVYSGGMMGHSVSGVWSTYPTYDLKSTIYVVTGAYCWYNNDIVNKTPYGALYNWYAVDSVHGLAPTGWRISNINDWTTLATYAGGDTVAGGKLKEIGTANWTTPNTGATDDYGFKGLPGGFRAMNGTFNSLGLSNHLWTSTNQVNPPYKRLNGSNTYITNGNDSKIVGMSVRCVKDI